MQGSQEVGKEVGWSVGRSVGWLVRSFLPNLSTSLPAAAPVIGAETQREAWRAPAMVT